MFANGAPGLSVAVAAAALAGLSGCNRHDSSLYADTSTIAAAPATPRQGYVGRWAATAQDCAAHAWTFASTRVSAGDGTVCDIESADASTAGYSLPGICRRPSGAVPGRLLLTFANPDAMTLVGGPYRQPVTLVRCPSEGTAPVRLTAAG